MDELERPSPKGMAHRRPNLLPRPQPQRSRWQAIADLPKRHHPVDLAWCDTGTLLSLAHRPAMLDTVLGLYGPSLVVTQAVVREIRKMASTPYSRRTAENSLRCNSADRIVQRLDAGDIPERPLPLANDTLDKVDRVLRQLDAIDQQQSVTTDRTDDAVSSSFKHTGEAHSIVSAMRTMALGRSTVLLTNDNGAMLVAAEAGIPWKHTGQLLAEVGCQDPTMGAELLLDQFNQMTSNFATVPTEVRPRTADYFVCQQSNGTCRLCDPDT